MRAPELLTVAISGSRHLRDRALIFSALDQRAIAAIASGFELHLHLGDAQGVDATAIYWARDRAIGSRTIWFASADVYRCFGSTAEEGESLILAADWDRLGYAAGAIRNRAMLEGRTADWGEICPVVGCAGPADELWAMRVADAPNRNRGTDNARMQAKSMGATVWTYTVGADGWRD